MKLSFLLLISAGILILPMEDKLKIDFGKGKDGQDWRITNDGVMGGLSRGQAQFKESSLYYSGRISLENNGGFSSFRGPYTYTDLSDYETLTIRCKGNGQTLAVTLDINQRWYQPYFKKRIELEGEDWQTIELPLKEFKAYRVGQYLGQKLSAEYLDKIIRIGFITDDKKEGNFEFEIDYLQFK